MKYTKNLILVLVFVIMVATFVSCGPKKNEKETVETKEAQTEIETDNNTTLPDKVWDETVNILACSGSPVNDIYVEEMTTDSFNNLVYNRNMMIEEKYGITVKYFDQSGSQQGFNERISPEFNSQMSSFDIIKGPPAYTVDLILKLYLTDLNDLSYLNFSNDYWDIEVNKVLTVNNHQFICTGDMNINQYAGAAILVYNRQQLADNGYTDDKDLRILAKNYDWYLEDMVELTINCSKLDNGTGKVLNYGYVMAGYEKFYQILAGSCDVSLIAKDENDTPYYVFNEASAVFTVNDAIDAALELFNGSQTYVQRYSTTTPKAIDLFLENNAAIYHGIVDTIMTLRAQGDIDYGFVPFPRYNEDSKKEYKTMTSPTNADIIAVPYYSSQKELAGFALEALCANSQDMKEEYIEIQCKIRGTVVEEEVEMFTMATEHVIFDPGVIYDWGALYMHVFVDYGSFESIPKSGFNDFNRLWATKRDGSNKAITDFIAKIVERDTLKEQ